MKIDTNWYHVLSQNYGRISTYVFPIVWKGQTPLRLNLYRSQGSHQNRQTIICLGCTFATVISIFTSPLPHTFFRPQHSKVESTYLMFKWFLLSNLRIIQVGWDIETENINFGTEWKWLIQPVLLHHHQIVTRLTKNRHFDN